jgi:hypothetical protein
MLPGIRNAGMPSPIGSATLTDVASLPDGETKEERDARLLILLGEVIRLSQFWVRALEAGDPFTAEKWEAECIRAMDRFEVNRKNRQYAAASFEKTL